MRFSKTLKEEDSEAALLYRQDLEKTRTRTRTEKGDLISPRYLKSDDQRHTKLIDSILSRFDAGTLLIDFAINPKKKTEMKLEVEFKGDCYWLFGSKTSNQVFNSVDSFIHHITNSLYTVNQDVDKKAVRENLFDPESFNRVVKQLREFALEYPKKTRSLKKEGEWDVEIKFRRSLRRLSGVKFPSDISSKYVIYPSISGENKWGRIISPDEVETSDSTLWQESK